MRVLLDTNVLAIGMAGATLDQRHHSALIWSRLQAKDFDILLSAHLLAELEHTWSSKWFQDRLTPDTMATLRSLLTSQAILVEITDEVDGVANH